MESAKSELGRVNRQSKSPIDDTVIVQLAASDLATGLRQAAAVLLSSTSQPRQLEAAANTAHALFSGAAGFKALPETPEEELETLLPGGMAISPRAAALCVTDYFRTATFVRGVYADISDLRARFHGEKIEVVYAGCGPFAPLFVLPMLVMEREGIQFTLIDAHRRSLDAAREIVRTLQLDGNVRYSVCTDAATYRHRGGGGFHLAITETMQRALESEPQVAVTANLAPQLKRGGLLIPERISVVAYLADRAREFTPPVAPDRIRLAELLEVSARRAHALHDPPAVRVEIPKVTDNHYMLALWTEVGVFGAYSLDEYASGITTPVWLCNVLSHDTPAEIEFTYEHGFRPRFRFRSSAPRIRSAC